MSYPLIDESTSGVKIENFAYPLFSGKPEEKKGITEKSGVDKVGGKAEIAVIVKRG